ncbi:Protein of unknown function [Bacillus mycoides]|nr:Protein of unknown function [Bacillus mycoides]
MRQRNKKITKAIMQLSLLDGFCYTNDSVLVQKPFDRDIEPTWTVQ